jgi:hypothetical protein
LPPDSISTLIDKTSAEKAILLYTSAVPLMKAVCGC